MCSNNEVSKRICQNRPWITSDLFQSICPDQNMAVQSFWLAPAVPKGENYSSDLIRATVIYKHLSHQHKTKTITLIIKVDLNSDEMANLLDEYDVFKREIVVFRDIAPCVMEMLNFIGFKTKILPICHYTSVDPKFLVFEDLRCDAFRNGNRRDGLNFEHLESALLKLAEWHAATALLGINDPKIMDDHRKGNINEIQTAFYPLFENSVQACSDEVRNWDWDQSERIAKKLEKLKHTIVQKGCDLFKNTCNDDFKVLVHGDLWVNNIMYKYRSDGCLEDCILVDWATGNWNSPGIDLGYLLFSSSDKTVREQEWDKLIQIYHKKLCDCLVRLNYPKALPTLTSLQIDFLTSGMYGVIFSFFLIPIRLIEDISANSDLSGLLGASDEAQAFRKRLFGIHSYKESVIYLLDYLDRKGFLD